MRLVNPDGHEIYYNTVNKHGKLCYVVQAIGDHHIIGRDKQKRKTRTFSQEHQAEAWVKRHKYVAPYAAKWGAFLSNINLQGLPC